jgi:MFS family permease
MGSEWKSHFTSRLKPSRFSDRGGRFARLLIEALSHHPIHAGHSRCTVEDAVPTEPISQQARRVVWLLAAAVFINYFDRGNLATASPLLQRQLALSNSELGALFSAFFCSYAPLQPIAGWLAQRFDVRYVLGGGLALWALATALTGLATSFAMIFMLRILLGFGESVAYPCNAKFVAQRVPSDQRGRANGLIAVGQSLGPTCGTLAGGLVMAHFGWRPAFIVFGVLSLAWLIPQHTRRLCSCRRSQSPHLRHSIANTDFRLCDAQSRRLYLPLGTG